MNESSPSDLPPDIPRLEIVRDYLADQHARTTVLETYLRLQLDRADAALAAARDRAARTQAGDRYRLVPIRLRPGYSELHQDTCVAPGGTVLTPSEARDAVTDDQISPRVELCTSCRPQDTLN